MKAWTPQALVVGNDLVLEESTVCPNCLTREDWNMGGDHPTPVRWSEVMASDPDEQCDRCGQPLILIAARRLNDLPNRD